ncbi:MAG: hypothetical protein F4Y78_03510 [Candidatus Dadabacteria bacterium]|nr:hypothetical protein [Candidatus Dadabacteria bacterium]MYA48664.1 hypothetical protein [Candidatus Dadabacteria bacterium]MYF48022.1 hypothetical protein [Candidatus Dadabacteria bacterium]MYK48707.1 hypothetical protein [Candidatus Dadabacteria bacterium]
MKSILHVATITLAILLFPLLLFPRAEVAYAQANPREELSVKDYSWKSYGVGRMATLGKVTVANSGKNSYKNIKIRVDLFTRTGKLLGSLQGTIPEELPAESEKTFSNLDLGLMNADLEESEAMVVGAEVSGNSSSTSAENVIFIKNWEFEGASFGTEGFITEITLENTGKIHFKNIKILLTEKDGGDRPGSTHLSSVVIHDVLPAGAERTFTGINVGFSSPNALERSIAISGAVPITTKELNYILGGGGSIGEKIKEKISSVSILRKKDGEKKAESQQKISSPDKAESGYEGGAESPSPSAETAMERSTQPYQEQLRESFPKHDIVIREFKWGSGIPGSTATLSKLVIENISDITYEKIEFEIEFFTSSNAPFGSNRFKVKKVLAPGQVMRLKNVQVGFISKLPDPNYIKLRVVKAKAVM